MYRASLVIAAHNEGELLAKTIESCLEGSPDLNFEIVVADDASTDTSVEQVVNRFPLVQVFRNERRQGTAATKALGARNAHGDVLVYLDAHCKPEFGSLLRLVESVEQLNGQAIVTPAMPALDVQQWRNDLSQVGHGYAMTLRSFECHWQSSTELKVVTEGRRQYHESPALIGAVMAMSRDLHDRLWGIDPQMRSWGVEDLDLGLKCWLMGYRILNDPNALVGHRFRSQFDNYSVPLEDLLTNQMRMAFKNFTSSVWAEWLDGCRQRNSESLPGHPEGLFARSWYLFNLHRASAEQERSYLHARRLRDEFWYAQRFGLSWPKLQPEAAPKPFATAFAVGASPSPSPSPKPLLSRRNIAALSQSDIAALIDAILKLKSEIPLGSTISSYAKYVKVHSDAMMHPSPWSHDNDPQFPPLPPPGMSRRNAAHSGPSFFPWHRQMILLYERDLQRVSGNPSLTLPYWDWAADQDSGTPPATWKVFQVFSLGAKTNIGFGGDGDPSGNVQTGSFRVGAWQIVDQNGVLMPGSSGSLQREFGRDTTAPTLPTGKDVSDAFNLGSYDTAPWDTRSASSFRNSDEGWCAPNGTNPDPKGQPELHNRVHVWVGGSMAPMTSPNDPIFFLHHCNVDRLWSQWLATHPGTYLPTSGGPPGHNLNDLMFPWDGVASALQVSPASVLDMRVLGYQYV